MIYLLRKTPIQNKDWGFGTRILSEEITGQNENPVYAKHGRHKIIKIMGNCKFSLHFTTKRTKPVDLISLVWKKIIQVDYKEDTNALKQMNL